MPTQVQWRRGTTTQHSTFTGAVGEVTVDTTLNTVRIHDGSTAGGFPLLGAAGGTVIGNINLGGTANNYNLGSGSIYWANIYTYNMSLYTLRPVAQSDTTVAQATGMLWYSSTGYMYRYWTDVSGLEVDVGFQVLTPVVNQYSGSISAGTPVKLTGSTLNNGEIIPYVSPCTADTRTNLEPFVGIAACNMSSGAKGYVISEGIVKNINTSAFSVGNRVYVSSSGGLTATKPTPGSNGYAIVKCVGSIAVADATYGKIWVRISDEFATNYSAKSVLYSKSNEIFQDNSNFQYDDGASKLTVTNITASTALTSSGTLSVTGNGTVGGTLGVSGATTLSSTLGVSGAATFSSTGTFGSTVSAPTFSASSDKRLKKNIKNIDGALDKIKALRGVTFAWKSNGQPQIGLIAQEVQKILPEVVNETDVGLGVSYQNIVAVLIEAVKDQQDQIDALTKKLGSK